MHCDKLLDSPMASLLLVSYVVHDQPTLKASIAQQVRNTLHLHLSWMIERAIDTHVQ